MKKADSKINLSAKSAENHHSKVHVFVCYHHTCLKHGKVIMSVHTVLDLVTVYM